MSSGPGKIQQLILSNLSTTPLLYNKLLWELAEPCGAILDTGQFGSIRKGEITRSFAESLRRAVKSLESEGKLTITERKFDSLQETLSNSPYLTTNLVLHQLRKKTQNHILDYISTKPRRNRKIDFEEFTVKLTQEDAPDVFDGLNAKWREIEQEIFSFLSAYPKQLDVWISIINRGRYLFEGRKPVFDLPLHWLITRITPDDVCASTQGMIHSLLDEMSKLESWRVGKIKYDLYNVMNIGRNTRTTSLDDGLKEYLFDLDKHLYVGMPGHIEPAARNRGPGFVNLSSIISRKFDPLLDKILSRDLFKSHKYLSLP